MIIHISKKRYDQILLPMILKKSN